MVREMNKISLYEAIRRKKEAEGLDSPPQNQPIPQQKLKSEPRINLKPSPSQVKPGGGASVPVSPAMKPMTKPRVVLKGQTLKMPKKPSRVMVVIREMLNDKALLKWAGIGAATVFVIVVGVSLIAKAIKTTDVVIEPPKSTKFEQPIDRDRVVRDYTAPKKAAEPLVETPKPVASPRVEQPAAAKPVEQPKPQLPAAVQNQLQKKPETAKVVSSGDNAIVIVAYTKKNDLLPVQDYFKANGIATEIIQDGSYYYVVTQSRFDTVNKPGSEGYQLKQKIKQLGANYKAPAGFERFASKPFQDVYGKKISK